MISHHSYVQRRFQISLYLTFRRILIFCLLGYAFLGKGFAYIGYPPFYVDAFIVGVCLYYIFYKKLWSLGKDISVFILYLFMIWGLIRTIPYLKEYRIDALRDSVIYFYANLAIVVIYLTKRYAFERYIVAWYAKWMKWLPIWAFVGISISLFWRDYVPRWPWGPMGGVSIVYLKTGDVAVHLAGIFAFFVLVSPYLKQKFFESFFSNLSWAGTLLLVIFRSRSAFLVTFVSFLLLVPYIKFKDLIKLIMVSFFVILVLISLLILDVNKDIGGGRTISFEQIIINVQSIFVDTNSYVDNTKYWRLLWWQEIINYTINGPYFWLGKGFGINLADDDGFQVTPDGSLRSPHNFHLAILARSGFPGFILWIMFITTLLVRLWRGAVISKNKNTFQKGLRLWILVYLITMLINATFDVYLEGPMGGVWFWTLCGLGIGILLKK